MEDAETAQAFCARTIKGLAKKADHNKREALASFVVVIAATLATPLFVTLGDGTFLGKVVPSLLSLLAAGATAWLQLRKPQQLWAIYRTAQRDLEDQLTRHRFGLTPYDAVTDIDKELAGHVAEITLRVHHQWLPMIPNPDNLRSIQPQTHATGSTIENANVSRLSGRQKPLSTTFGDFDFYCFSWGSHEEDNVLCQHKTPYTAGAPLVRVQSACYTAEIFRSLDCDCHAQLKRSLERIQEEGGLLIYMLCDGRGAGLLNKVRGLELGHSNGLDTSDAYKALGLEQDPRQYDRVVEVLKYFGLNQVRLLTNNPRKIDGLVAGGIDVEREPLEIPATDNSRPYLKTKAEKMGHLLNQFQDPCKSSF